MDYKNLFQSKNFSRLLWIIGILIIVLVIFHAGILVGYHRAEFSFRGGENYYQNFGGRRGNFLMGMHHDQDFSNSHGAIGKIVKIDTPSSTFVIEDQDKVEKIIDIAGDTAIRRFRDDIKLADLKINDFVVVIGSPNDAGQIKAQVVRVMPAPPEFFMGAGTSTNNH